MKFLERSLDNQNQWWKYLVMVGVSFLGAQFIGSVPLLAVMLLHEAKSSGPAVGSGNVLDMAQYGLHPNVGLVLMLLPFVVSLLAMALLLKPLHKRTIAETINGRSSIRWGRFFTSLALWGAIMAVYLLVGIGMDPANFTLNFNAANFVGLVLVALLMLPLQTAYEELLFRGYLAQGVAALTRRRWAVLLVPSLLFALMHILNPEVQANGFWAAMPQYFMFGLLFGLASVLDDGIEVAMGAHTANNVFLAVFVTNADSTLQTPALFVQHRMDPLWDTLALLACGMIFVTVLGMRYRWNFMVLGQRVALGNRD